MTDPKPESTLADALARVRQYIEGFEMGGPHSIGVGMLRVDDLRALVRAAAGELPHPREVVGGDFSSPDEVAADSRRLAKLLESHLPRGVGFTLFTFSYGAEPGHPGGFAYISSARREDMILTIGEWLMRQLEADQEKRHD